METKFPQDGSSTSGAGLNAAQVAQARSILIIFTTFKYQKTRHQP
jgi:hypothetical protein